MDAAERMQTMNKEAIGTGAGAAATSVLSAAAPTIVPALQPFVALCNGICGACSGGCIAAVGSVGWISVMAMYHRYKKETDNE